MNSIECSLAKFGFYIKEKSTITNGLTDNRFYTKNQKIHELNEVQGQDQFKKEKESLYLERSSEQFFMQRTKKASFMKNNQG